MAKHFVSTGGCGIRPFLDIWVLNHKIDFNREKREKLLSDGGLDVFAKQAELLSEVWFGNINIIGNTLKQVVKNKDEENGMLHLYDKNVWESLYKQCYMLM